MFHIKRSFLPEGEKREVFTVNKKCNEQGRTRKCALINNTGVEHETRKKLRESAGREQRTWLRRMLRVTHKPLSYNTTKSFLQEDSPVRRCFSGVKWVREFVANTRWRKRQQCRIKDCKKQKRLRWKSAQAFLFGCYCRIRSWLSRWQGLLQQF